MAANGAEEPAKQKPTVEPAEVTVDPTRLVKIIDTIGFDIIENEAKQIHKLAQKGKQPIFLLLNSPGGSVAAGTTVLDAINAAKHNGIQVKCVVGSLAASMAFVILTHCDERYTLENSKLLFHPMSLSGRNMKVEHLATIIPLMYASELAMKKRMRQALKMDEAKFDAHYRAETLWEAHELAKESPGFLKIIKDIKGVPDIFTFTKPRRSIFGKSKPTSTRRPVLDPTWK